LQGLHVACNSYVDCCCHVVWQKCTDILENPVASFTRVDESLFHPFSLLYHDILPYVVAGGHSTFFALLNTFVHIIMYFYYMISAMGPKYQKYIWWKKYLTTFQMVTFIALTC